MCCYMHASMQKIDYLINSGAYTSHMTGTKLASLTKHIMMIWVNLRLKLLTMNTNLTTILADYIAKSLSPTPSLLHVYVRMCSSQVG